MKRISKFLAAGMLALVVLIAPLNGAFSQNGEQGSSAAAVTEPVKSPAAQAAKPGLPVSDWRTPPAQTGPGVWGMLKGLGLCLAVFFIGIWLLKKTKAIAAPAGGRRNFKIIERFPISPRSALLLVEYKGREVVLAVGNEQVSVVDDGLNTLLAGGAVEDIEPAEKGETR